MSENDSNTVLLPDNIPSVENDNMVHGVYYAHYLRKQLNQPYPTYYGTLISQAINKIYIWDPYFHYPDTAIFRYLRSAVEVYVLSSKTYDKKDTYLDALLAATSSSIVSSVRGQCRFYFGFIDKSRYGAEVWNTHDRFLIVDDRYFLVGASVAHHLASHESTGIYQLTEPADKNIVQNAFNHCWQICVSDSMYKTQVL